MLKKITTASLALAALTCGSQAMAANYVGGNIAAIEAGDADLVALYGRLGTEFSENFSGEVRLGTGIDDDTINGNKVKLKHLVGAYVRGGIPVGDVFFPYATVGFTDVKLSSGGYSDSGNDVSFGFGTDIRINPNVDLNLEYMNYYDKHNVTIDGFSVGATYRF